MRKRVLLIATSLLLFTLMSGAYAAQDPFKSTPYPIPRFVSLNSHEINVRAGPGGQYPIKWVFTKKYYPVEIILEYDTWRKIRDIEGDEGWVHGSLLSGRRYGMIVADAPVTVFSKPQPQARAKLKLEPGVRLRLLECQKAWCRGEIADTKGWLEKKFIYGVYDSEKFD